MTGAVLGVCAFAVVGHAAAPRAAAVLQSSYERAHAQSAPAAPAAAPSPPAMAPSPAAVATTGFPSSDINCLAAAVYYEARGEVADGQAAVAQVVLNRARHPAFPKSVCGVVYQGKHSGACQFSFVCNGAMDRPREPGAWTRARRVAVRAMGGYVIAAVGKDTSFHAIRVRGPRSSGALTRIGGQVFYAPHA
ncbi:MAG: cell wall hydrolase [Caulobacteraceae bacterium]